MAKERNKPQKEAQQAAPAIQAAEAVEFESWYAQREDLIPKHHYREILRADFKSRGLKDMATMEQWDGALKQYGVELAN